MPSKSMNLDPRVVAIRDQYGLADDDFWELKQKPGTYAAKHAALEIVAVKSIIRFDMPVIIEAHGGEGVAAVCVQGQMGDRVEWSIGEASPKNNKNSYPWAMAEKRAKDRVILKLIGVHGLIYSEEEADDFKDEAARTVLQRERREMWATLRDELDEIQTLPLLNLRLVDQRFLSDVAKLSDSNKALLREHIRSIRDAFIAAGEENAFPGDAKPKVEPTFDNLEPPPPEYGPEDYIRA